MTKPKINPPLRTIDIIIEALAAICLIYLVAELIIEYPSIGPTVPTHFGVDDNPDAWGDKSYLLIIPVISIVMYVGLTVLNKYPHLFNYPVSITETNAMKQYQYAKSLIRAVKFTTTGLFLYIQHQTLLSARQLHTCMEAYYVIVLVTGTFIPIIIYLAIANRNK